ncbi:MAG: HPr family phosphocarrier protein [Oscillospiraceae bacterium]|nr:HPr family phosphocarrier protein [Oscillospiraceae bacterium]
MKQFHIMLGSVSDVQDFVRSASMRQFNVEAILDTERVDAKSIMGLFTLDLRKPLLIEVDGGDEQVDDFMKEIGNVVLAS